jgi:prepilin-type N-terminal cleavage/methylation domain-containing protein
MTVSARRVRPRIGDDSGVTLIELMVVVSLLVVVLGAVLVFAETGTNIAAKDRARNVSIVAARAGFYRMTRELRQGSPPTGATLPTADTNTVDLVLNTTTPQRVVYDCSFQPAGATYRQCKRWSSTTLTSSPEPFDKSGGTVVVDGVTGPANVFGANTVQSVAISGAPTAGTFTLTYAVNSTSYTTAPIAYNATASDVATAVHALAPFSGLTITGGDGPLTTNSVTLTFQNAAGIAAIPIPTADSTALTGGIGTAVTAAAKPFFSVTAQLSVKGDRKSGYADSSLRDGFYLRNAGSSSL